MEDELKEFSNGIKILFTHKADCEFVVGKQHAICQSVRYGNKIEKTTTWVTKRDLAYMGIKSKNGDRFCVGGGFVFVPIRCREGKKNG